MIVIDTHILIWYISNPDLLSKNARDAIQNTFDSGQNLIVSAITAWEISMLVVKGRLTLTMDVERWLEAVSKIKGIQFMPIDTEIALKTALLPGDFHKNPADRMIVATARKLGASLITADKKIRDYQHIKTIW